MSGSGPPDEDDGRLDVDLGPTAVPDGKPAPGSDSGEKSDPRLAAVGPQAALTHGLPIRMGRYLLTHRLGVGGMAEVFLAKQDGVAGFQKTCVVKRILPHLAVDPHFVQMFQEEAKVAALLQHTNVAQVYELGAVEGSYFIAMEYVEGAPLNRLARATWRAEKPLPMEVSCCAIADAALGLQAAHELCDDDGKPLHVVHRDISPDNLIINREGVTKILDFGVAKTAASEKTQSGQIKGKIPFLSPEQIDGVEIDQRVDVYALGVSFYWLLVGRRPFSGASDLQTMNAIIAGNAAPPKSINPSVPDEIDTLVMRMMAKSREDRPSTVEIHDALSAALVTRRSVVGPFVRAMLKETWITGNEVTGPVPTSPGFLPSTPHSPTSWVTKKKAEESQPATASRGYPSSAAATTSDLPAPRKKLVAAVAAGAGIAVVGMVALFATRDRAPPPQQQPHEAPVSAQQVPAPSTPPPASAASAPPPPSSVESAPPVDTAPAASAKALVGGAKRSLDVKAPAHVRWLDASNNKPLGSGTATLKLSAGARKIIALDTHNGGRAAVPVPAGAHAIDYGALPRGKIDPRATPFADAVFLGPQALGPTPIAKIDVVAGTYTLRFVREGKEQKRTVEVKGGGVVRVVVDFTK